MRSSNMCIIFGKTMKGLMATFLISSVASAIGQVEPGGSFDFMGHPSSYIHLNNYKEMNETGYFEFRKRYSEVVGSPYWHNQQYVIADMTLNDGSVIQDVSVQYDVYTDEIIAIQEDKGEFIIDARYFNSITIDDGLRRTYFRKSHPDYPTKFYETISETEQYTFFKDVDISYNIQEIRVTGLTSEIKRFNRKNLYFLLTGLYVHKFRLNKRDILEVIPKSKRTSLKKFVRENDLKYKDEEDVKTMLQHVFKQ